MLNNLEIEIRYFRDCVVKPYRTRPTSITLLGAKISAVKHRQYAAPFKHTVPLPLCGFKTLCKCSLINQNTSLHSFSSICSMSGLMAEAINVRNKIVFGPTMLCDVEMI